MCLILTVGSTSEMVPYCIVLYAVYQCTLNIFISYCKTNCKHNRDVIQQEATYTLWTDKRRWWWHVNTECTSTRWRCRSKWWRWRDMKSYIAGRWYKNTWRWWRYHLLCQTHIFISTETKRSNFAAEMQRWATAFCFWPAFKDLGSSHLCRCCIIGIMYTTGCQGHKEA